jgi:hypothetical protein
MANRHTTNGAYTNPDVKFERSDIKLSSVALIGGGLSLLILVLAVLTTWLGLGLTRAENRRKRTTLPEAAVDRDRPAPGPRLEGIEDLAEGRVALYPPRAKIYLQPQEEEIARGNKKEGILPVGEVIRKPPPKLFPAQKHGPPSSFGVPLPSKSSSGRVETGGK